MDETPEILKEGLARTSAGGTVLVVAPDQARLEALMRTLFELALAGDADPVPWDDRTVRVGDGFCAFFTSETIDFVLERKRWYGARQVGSSGRPDGAARAASPPVILWDEGARERAAEWARLIPDKSIDRSHLLFGKTSPEHDERR